MSVEDKKRLGRRFFKGYTKLVESKYWYNHYVALIFGASPASNLGSLIAIDWKGNELISVTRFFGNNDNVKLYLGSNPETNMYELWLGLIGLDGDGSEFIIQSRESIDLDSKTVETLPSYLKVISISWQKNNDFSELGELIGNATSNKSGLMSSGMVPLELSKDNNQYCKISVFMPNAGSINESVISVTNVGGDSFSVAVSMIRWNANKVFCKLINGTKISNINMYYTVDTERFCFYIKANWYAKIIVSRLGLVNTSKIESINVIPSGAIEVPISWRDKRYSTELGELIGINETWFRNRGYIRGEINLDDFKNAGAYSLFNVEGNNVPTSWAQLLIFSSGYYIIQIIVDISSRKLFIRRYDTENDRWQEWGNIIIT